MATKEFFWIKIDEHFFDTDGTDQTIAFIRDQEGGSDYLLFYLILLAKAARTDGKLMRMAGEYVLPYDDKSLARLTGMDISIVRCAMELLMKLGLIKRMDGGELWLTQMEEMVGSETDAARRMRSVRARKNGTLPDAAGGNALALPEKTALPENAPADSDDENDGSEHCYADGEHCSKMLHREKVRDKSNNNNNTDSDESDHHSGEGQEASGQGGAVSPKEETTLTQDAVDRILAAWNGLHDKHPEMIAKASRVRPMSNTWLGMEKLVTHLGTDTVCEMIACIDRTRPYRNIDYYRQQGQAVNKIKIDWFVSDKTDKQQEIIDDYYDAQEQAAKAAEAAAQEAAAREAEQRRMYGEQQQSPFSGYGYGYQTPAYKQEDDSIDMDGLF